MSPPAKSATQWKQSDLVRRVIHALDVAVQTIQILPNLHAARSENSCPPVTKGLLSEKVVAEAAMLLLCVYPIQTVDARIQDKLNAVASLLVPCARHHQVLAAICLDPGLARDHALAHVVLSAIGYPNRGIDRLLSASLAMGPDFGPERLPHRCLEQRWLARVWDIGEATKGRESQVIAESMLGRPMDAFGSTREDIYAFTHAVMYASDLGERRVMLPRRARAIAADAEIALAFSLDSSDFDLTAEILLTWPMLSLPWSPEAIFAFSILADMEDQIGFLPGSAFDLDCYNRLTGEQQTQFALVTSYHTAFVMGFLCATALKRGRAPPAAVPPARRLHGAVEALSRLVGMENPVPCWWEPFYALSNNQQDSIATLLLAIVLRRAKTEANLGLLQKLLEIALAHDLVGSPAVIQAAALLRRVQVLDYAVQKQRELTVFPHAAIIGERPYIARHDREF